MARPPATNCEIGCAYAPRRGWPESAARAALAQRAGATGSLQVRCDQDVGPAAQEARVGGFHGSEPVACVILADAIERLDKALCDRRLVARHHENVDTVGPGQRIGDLPRGKPARDREQSRAEVQGCREVVFFPVIDLAGRAQSVSGGYTVERR